MNTKSIDDDQDIVTRIEDNVDGAYTVFVEFDGHIERYGFYPDVDRTQATESSIQYFRDNCPFLFDDMAVVESCDARKSCDASDFGAGCKNPVSSRHSCPFDVEVHGAAESACVCDCCEICTEKCNRNI